MTITRFAVETILVKRAGALMAVADLKDTVGGNDDLNDPIGYALRKSGYDVASIVLVADADLASLADADVDQVLDIAELRLLENIQGNLDDVDIRTGPYSENLSQLTVNLEKRIARLKATITEEYGILTTAGEIEAGVIGLDFAEHNEQMSET